MKNYCLLLLFVFTLFSCSDDRTDRPEMELLTIYLNGGEVDYSRNIGDILPLSPGDELDISFTLDGNGTDLKSFMVTVDKSEDKIINTSLFFYGDEVSDEFSDPKNGLIGYKDGVENTWVAVKLKVSKAKEEDVKVSFYLNSKAPDCEGASYYLDLKTTTEPRVQPDEESNEE